MPQKSTIERARKDAREGKSPSTQAGEFVRKVIHAIREGKHGARSPKQAIAIGLSEARRAGVKLPKAPKGTASRKSKSSTKKSGKAVHSAAHPTTTHSTTRSRATTRALKREPHSSASHAALSKHAHQAAKKRSPSSRKASAQKAARTRKHTRQTHQEAYA